MTDSDRVALPAFLPTFLFCFIHLFMPTSTPTGMPLQFVIHHITPDRSSSSINTTCFLRTSHQHLGQANHATIFPALFPLVLPQHLSAGPLPFLPPFAANSNRKNLQSRSLPSLPSFASQHAHTHLLRSHIYVSITPGGIYLAPKRRILLGKRGARALQKAVRSEQILYRSTKYKNNYYNS
jgi:hypothetical protein